jgi:hypothetical protein
VLYFYIFTESGRIEFFHVINLHDHQIIPLQGIRFHQIKFKIIQSFIFFLSNLISRNWPLLILSIQWVCALFDLIVLNNYSFLE